MKTPILLLGLVLAGCVSRTVEMPVEVNGKTQVIRAKFVRGLTNEKLGSLKLKYDGMEFEIQAMESDQTSAIEAVGKVVIEGVKAGKGL